MSEELDSAGREELFKSICGSLDKLDYNQLLEVNRQAVNTIKFLRSKKAAAFKIGDCVEFTSARTGKTHICRIDRIGTTAVWLTELRVDGTPKDRFEHPGFKVSASLLRPATAPVAAPPPPAPAPSTSESEEEDIFDEDEAPTSAPEPLPEEPPAPAAPVLPTATSDIAGAW